MESNNNGLNAPLQRFFLCTFSGLDEENDLRTGKVMCKTSNGRHVSEMFVINLICRDFNFNAVYVTHVNEMTEDDFNDFTEGMDNFHDSSQDESTFL
jgi:hypothetical protein